MAVKLLCLYLLLAGFCPTWAKEQKCLKSASNCEECLQSGPECAWCIVSESNVRCDTPEGLRRSSCHKSYIYNPQGWVKIVKNDSRIEPEDATTFLLQPQELSLSLRPGVSQSFPVTIPMSTDQPITVMNIDTSPVPEGVNITFNRSIKGNLLVIQVNVEAARCPTESNNSHQKQNQTGPWSVYITPRGFSQSVKLEITFECQCECTNIHEENSPGCSGRGTLVCGQCMCNEPYIGQKCQIDSLLPTNEDLCRSGPNATVCSGRGLCVAEGLCECERLENPAERYSGRYCECSNFDCPMFNGSLCGGHGKCECGVCVCDHGWTDEDCSCTTDTASCMATNQMVCNGKGQCRCGECDCDVPSVGPTCEFCLFCEGICSRFSDCVECLVFMIGPKKDTCERDCRHLTVRKTDTKSFPDQEGTYYCKMRNNEDDCHFYYAISRSPSGERILDVWDSRECPRTFYGGMMWGA